MGASGDDLSLHRENALNKTMVDPPFVNSPVYDNRCRQGKKRGLENTRQGWVELGSKRNKDYDLVGKLLWVP